MTSLYHARKHLSLSQHPTTMILALISAPTNEALNTILLAVAIYKLHQLRKGQMATKADLDAAVTTLTADDAAVLSAVSTSGTAIGTSLKNLLDKINANPTAPAADFSDEVAALAQDHTDFQAAIASLNTIAQTATTDDPGPQPTGDAPTS